MDEMKVNLSGRFMKSIITKLIARVVRKQFGYDVDIQINELNIEAIDGKVRLHMNVNAETTQEEFAKIVDKIG